MEYRAVKNQSIKCLEKCTGFLIEFFGYNFTASGVSKKIYVKVPFAKKECHDRNIKLDDDKLILISKALDSKYLYSFSSDRYSLYDISFRESGYQGRIGFNFIDLKDSTYIEPKEVLREFSDFGIDSVGDVVSDLQKNMFLQCPQYNPISMIGLVIDDNNNLTSMKTYIRFDIEEASSPVERVCMIERILKLIDASNLLFVECFFELSKRLENMGFVFAFVGVDFYVKNHKRFKLYFKFCGNNDMAEILNEISAMLSQFGLSDSMKEVTNKTYNGVWGLAISIDSVEYVNGVQLYLYP